MCSCTNKMNPPSPQDTFLLLLLLRLTRIHSKLIQTTSRHANRRQCRESQADTDWDCTGVCVCVCERERESKGDRKRKHEYTPHLKYRKRERSLERENACANRQREATRRRSRPPVETQCFPFFFVLRRANDELRRS